MHIVTDQYGNAGRSRKGKREALKNYIKNTQNKRARHLANKAAEMMKEYTPHELFDEAEPHCRQFEDIFESDITNLAVRHLKKMALNDSYLRELIYSNEYINVA